jgi:hypothetical protein
MGNGFATIAKQQEDYAKLTATDPKEYPKKFEEQTIYWECKFEASDSADGVSAECGKAKVYKTKHDGDRAKECFAAQFGGLVSALLVLTGLMN